MAKSSFQSIRCSLCREGIRSEKTMRRYTHLIPLPPLASVATSQNRREIRIIEMDNQDTRNRCHHLRSFRASNDKRVLEEGRRLPWRQSREKRLRRNGRLRGMTWQQWDRNPRVDSRSVSRTLGEDSKALTESRARCFLG